MAIRLRGGIAVVVAHRPNAIAAVDHILMMQDGRLHAFGRKEDVLERVLAKPTPVAPQTNSALKKASA